MDTSTGSADLLALLHPVRQQLYSAGFEVNVSVQGQDVRILSLTKQPHGLITETGINVCMLDILPDTV